MLRDCAASAILLLLSGCQATCDIYTSSLAVYLSILVDVLPAGCWLVVLEMAMVPTPQGTASQMPCPSTWPCTQPPNRTLAGPGRKGTWHLRCSTQAAC